MARRADSFLPKARAARQADRYTPSVLTAAVTGGDILPSQSPHIPCGASAIAAEALAAAESGAACVHLHAREESGRPSASGGLFAEIAAEIRASSDVVINVTTGGAPGMSVEDRLAGIRSIRPELATLNLGTMNYEGFPDPARWPKATHNWERQVLASTGKGVFINTLSMLREFAAAIYELDCTPELEAYDLGQITMARILIDEGTLHPPVRLQLVLGVVGGASNQLDELFVLRSRAREILGPDLASLGVAALGYPMQLRHAAAALALGMDCRVGLEDSVRVRRDRLAESNRELVEAAVRIADLIGRPLCTPAQLRGELQALETCAGAVR
jgi:uncharacterized protein (DUF849 family)